MKSSLSKKTENLMKGGIQSKMPASVAPMLCTLTRGVIQDDKYLYELKWDGYRIISSAEKGKVKMDSRSSLNYTHKYPVVAKALAALKHDIVLDGEVVVFNEDGLPDFDALQLYDGHETPLTYCIFDVLWLDGYDLKKLRLTERKEILSQILKGNSILRFSESFEDGPSLY